VRKRLDRKSKSAHTTTVAHSKKQNKPLQTVKATPNKPKVVKKTAMQKKAMHERAREAGLMKKLASLEKQGLAIQKSETKVTSQEKAVQEKAERVAQRTRTLGASY